VRLHLSLAHCHLTCRQQSPDGQCAVCQLESWPAAPSAGCLNHLLLCRAIVLLESNMGMAALEELLVNAADGQVCHRLYAAWSVWCFLPLALL
jgi:hypothetical protein